MTVLRRGWVALGLLGVVLCAVGVVVGQWDVGQGIVDAHTAGIYDLGFVHCDAWEDGCFWRFLSVRRDAATGHNSISATRVVTTSADAGPGSLRQALLDAQPQDLVTFNSTVFPAANPMTISLLSALPDLSQGDVTIDASNVGVVLDGSAISGANGLYISSNDNVIKGLHIVNFHGHGIEITGGAQHNIIGGNWSVGGAPHGEGNIITLNDGDGIHIAGTGTMSNTVIGNLIGLDPDGAEDWRVQTMVISPEYADTATLFIGTHYHGIWRTDDAGDHWYPVNHGLTIVNVLAIVISPNYTVDQTLFAGTAEGSIFRTTDAGATWVRVDDGVAVDRKVLALAISPDYANDGHVFAVIDDIGIGFSADRGNTWELRNTGLTAAWAMRGLAISPGYATDKTLFALRGNVIFRSVDQAEHWNVVESTSTTINTLAISPQFSSDQTVIVGLDSCAPDPQLLKSTNGGNDWTGINNLPDMCSIRSIVFSPDHASDQTLYVGGDWVGVVKSTDRGISWQQVHDGRFNWSLAVSPAYAMDQTVFVGQHTGRMYRSGNAGQTWVQIGADLTEFGNLDDGIRICEGAQWNIVGGYTPGQRNVISNNGVHGVTIRDSGTDFNVVMGNYIGTDVHGVLPLGNDTEGLQIEGGACFNQIGGSEAGARNVIAANATSGVMLRYADAMHNVVIGNYIGVDVSGSTALGNHDYGVMLLEGTQQNRIEANVISGNGREGVIVGGNATRDNVFVGNYVGTDAGGASALGNYKAGMLLGENVQSNQVGGITSSERNLISGNQTYGVVLWGQGTEHNVLVGNYIGVDVTGVVSMGNRYAGVQIDGGACCNRVGGESSGEGNVISGNGHGGVVANGSGTMSNTVSANYIGTDASGAVGIGNGSSGVLLDGGAQYNLVGGSTTLARNVISANGHEGVGITDEATMSNTVMGNFIGVDANGTAVLSNCWSGVACWHNAQRNTIMNNLIGGNNANGIHFEGCHDSEITANFIGTDASGSLDLGNREHGISVFAGSQGNLIGPENVIAFNVSRGVGLWGATTLYNRITCNAIYHNGGLGIDTDEGANLDLTPPALTLAMPTRVHGFVLIPNATVELFSDEEGQGRYYEGTTVADASGYFTFSTATDFQGPNMTATTTDAAGNTSAFSEPSRVMSLVYLPLVVREYPSSLIVAYGFETGDFSGWVTGGDGPGLIPQVIVTPTYAGIYAAVLGQEDAPCQSEEGGLVGQSWIARTIDVPDEGSPKVKLYYRIFTYDRLNMDFYDRFEVYINDVLVGRFGNESGIYGCDYPVQDLGWQEATLDLGAYKGQTVEVKLVNITHPDDWYATWTYVDDVMVLRW